MHEILDATLRLASRQIAPVAALEIDYQATQWIYGDRAQLGGVFLNLITNAVQACDPPDPERHRTTVLTRDAGTGVEVEFHDTGVGIPQDAREQLFAPFFTTKDPGEGTGLGLYISRQVVQQHGGSLDFHCAEGGGTIFRVHLPGQIEDGGA